MRTVASLSTPTHRPSQNTKGPHKTESLAQYAASIRSGLVEPTDAQRRRRPGRISAQIRGGEGGQGPGKVVPFCAYEVLAKLSVYC